MNFKGNSLKSALGALAIGAGLLLGGSELAYAQDHQRHERQELREHQLRERYHYGDSRALREHQQRERFELERHQRFERRRYFDRGYGYGRGWGWGWRRRYGW